MTKTELQRLLADWSNNTLSTEDARRLDEQVRIDPTARDLYLQYATVEAELRSTFAGAGWIGSGLEKALETEESPTQPIALLKKVNQPQSVSRFTTFRRIGAMAIAASLIGVAAFMYQGDRFGIEPLAAVDSAAADLAIVDLAQGNVSAEGVAAETLVIARVTATRNCRWSEASSAIGFGAELLAGQHLQLDAGLVEITFDGGARVLLEGPAKLHLKVSDPSGPSSILESGRLAATLPAGWQVAPVQTERMGVMIAASGDTDASSKGLHFGLSADGQGKEEVHVFRGQLEAFLMPALNSGLDEATAFRTVSLGSREAARLLPASTTVAKFFADDDKFVRSISSTGGPQDGLYAYEGFDYPAGQLSGQNGGFGWAGAWADIEAACPPGELATNVVGEGGLHYPKLRSIGGHATQLAQQNRIRRALSTSLGGVFDSAGLVENQDGQRLVGANGQTVYLSFLQRVSKIDDGFYGLELHRGDGNKNRVLCIGNGAEGAGYGVTSNYNAYGKTNYARLGKESVTANLIVVKIEYGRQHRDVVTVYRNPRSLLDETVAMKEAESVVRLLGNFAFDRISLGNFDETKQHEVDELRVGTTYRAVTGRRDRGAEMLAPHFASTTFPTLIDPSQRRLTLGVLAAVHY